MPIARSDDAPGRLINLALIMVLVVGLFLSLRWRRQPSSAL